MVAVRYNRQGRRRHRANHKSGGEGKVDNDGSKSGLLASVSYIDVSSKIKGYRKRCESHTADTPIAPLPPQSSDPKDYDTLFIPIGIEDIALDFRNW